MQKNKAHKDRFPNHTSGQGRPMSREEIARLISNITNNELILPNCTNLTEIEKIDEDIRRELNL